MQVIVVEVGLTHNPNIMERSRPNVYFFHTIYGIVFGLRIAFANAASAAEYVSPDDVSRSFKEEIEYRSAQDSFG